MVKTLNSISIVMLIMVTMGIALPVCAGSLVDPMRPVNYQRVEVASSADEKVPVTENWNLSGVLISASRTVAVINGMSFQLGDNVDGYRITKITTSEAVLKNKQQTLVLHRSGTGLKKSAIKDNGKGLKP